MKKLLVLSQTWPEPSSSAAGSRMMQLLDLFLGKAYEITYAAVASESKHNADLETFPIKKQRIKPNDKAFDDFLKREMPDIVIFDRFMSEEQFGWRVSEICPKALRVLDTEDLHFLRKARQDAFLKDGNLKNINLFSDTAKREIASILRCDLSLIISEVEIELLQNQFKIDGNLLLYLPFLLKKIPENENFPDFEKRKHFISIGNFRHAPNLDMVFNLKENIWSFIKKQLPNAELHIYGAYPPKKIMELNDVKTGFLVKGRVRSSRKAFLASKILLAPLNFGAGLKGKIIEAMQCGTPSVSTEIGAEGIPGNLPFSGKIENSPENFAQAAVDLYQNKPEWEKAQQVGFKIINSRFQKMDFGEVFFSRLSHIHSNLENHRRENFLGAMLMHHSLQSTKYMSKWIEAKNDLKI